MRPPIRLRKGEVIVDLFAGGGGTSEGLKWATGRDPDVAVNHDPHAVVMHKINHPGTRHLVCDVREARPEAVSQGRSIGFLWLSPDCTYFSKSRGAKPFRDRKNARCRRGLAWVAVRYATSTVKPRIIVLENVEEFQDWGPLGPDNRPDPERRGLSFRRFVGRLRGLGYVVEWRELRASDYGAPTIRKRLFLIARCDGQPIVWPAPTHGPGTGQPYRSAAECIDWSIRCPSIFGRKKPLAEPTLRRVARGIQRFVIDATDPFLVPNDNAAATLQHSGNGERVGQDPRIYDIRQPLATVMATGQKHALVTAFLARHYSGHGNDGTPMTRPTSTITAKDHQSLVVGHLTKFFGTCVDGQDLRAPAPTVRAQGTHLAEVRAFLTRYNGTGKGQDIQLSLGTITTKDRFGLVMVHGEPYEISDIGLRMLQPRELYRAQGFPDSYVIDPIVETITKSGKRKRGPLSKTGQVRMCGNSVSPFMSCAIALANIYEEERVAA